MLDRMKQRSVIGIAAVFGMAVAGCAVTDVDDGDAEAVHASASVVASGTQCGVDFSIDHMTLVVMIGPSMLEPRAASTAVPSPLGSLPAVVAIDHLDSVAVTPSALAANHVAVSNTVTGSQTAAMGYGANVVATVVWNDTSEPAAANLCTASATSTITVHFSNGTTCQITKTTEFPTCLMKK
jgi:hypothetical protein